MNPTDRKYSKWHTWAKAEGDTVVVGITDYAQKQLNDIVALELPKVNTQATAGKAAGMVESTKTVHDIVSPLSGTITQLNTELEAAADKLNADPYGAWIFKIKPSKPAELEALMDAAAYEKSLG